MSDHIRLDEVLSDGDIEYWENSAKPFCEKVRACIRLAVEKAEKVEGFTSLDGSDKWGYFADSPSFWTAKIPPPLRHALLLLGPKVEPKTQKSADERIKEALEAHRPEGHVTNGCRCSQCRILRGDE